MAKSEEKKESRVQTKKKSWYRIISPQAFGQKELGEAYLAGQEAAVGRFVQVNLKELSGNVRDQSAYLTFQIVNAQPSGLQTAVVRYELTPSTVRRSVRKGANRIDGYFTCPVKNGTLVVKTLLIPLGHTVRSVQHALRKSYHEIIVEEAKKLTFEDFMVMLTSGRLRSLAKKKLDKIYPCRDAAIRVCFLKGTPSPVAEESHTAAAHKKVPEEVPRKVPERKVTSEEPSSDVSGDAGELIEGSMAGEVTA